FGTRFIAPLIPEFTHRYPLVEVDLGLSDTQQDLLKESWDLIVRIGHLADSDLRARRLGNCPMRLCASPEYLKKHGTPNRVAELSNHNCLSYSLSSEQRGGT
ncbi:MAG TPA: LysR family transcriptional regulator, partial [Alcanivorax sp.]|nr:LysR family transcriptional regulator [Alcanivorax sp.]